MGGPIDKISGSLDSSGGSYTRRYYFTRPKADRLVPNVFGFTYYAVKQNTSGTSTPRQAIVDVSPERADAYNAAHKKFVEALGERADMSETLAEWRQSSSMIARRGNQLYHFFKNLRKARFGDAFDALDLPRNRRFKPVAKDFAGKVLETNYGWIPLAMDIGSAVEILSQGDPGISVFGRGSRRNRRTVTTSPPPVGAGILSREIDINCRVHIGARVSVSNPNLWLANQLGFVNPVLTAWNLTPYSLVVDWFGNVSQFLEGFTYDVGLSVTDSFYTHYDVTPSSTTYRKPNGQIVVDKYDRAICSRYVGEIPRPTLRVLPLKGFSVKRAANAISMVLQQLPR
jgi:hypothetical protein